MPQRPARYQRRSRYCWATVRYALLIWMSRVDATASRSVFALCSRYGSTALLENCRFAVGANRTSDVSSMQPISSEICFDRPSTTAVEHVPDTYADTVAACDVSLSSSLAQPALITTVSTMEALVPAC